MRKDLGFAIVAIAVVAAAGGFYLGEISGRNPSSAPSADTPEAPATATSATATSAPATATSTPTSAASLPDAPIAFTLPDLDGKPHSLSEWKGKARLVNFWATWCAPCRREIPLLKQVQADHAADNLQVIGIAVDVLKDTREYAKTADFNYPILIGQDEAMAAAETSGIPFVGVPVTMVIAPDGRLIKAHMGEIDAAQIARIVDVLARLQRGELDLAAARRTLAPY